MEPFHDCSPRPGGGPDSTAGADKRGRPPPPPGEKPPPSPRGPPRLLGRFGQQPPREVPEVHSDGPWGRCCGFLLLDIKGGLHLLGSGSSGVEARWTDLKKTSMPSGERQPKHQEVREGWPRLAISAACEEMKQLPSGSSEGKGAASFYCPTEYTGKPRPGAGQLPKGKSPSPQDQGSAEDPAAEDTI